MQCAVTLDRAILELEKADDEHRLDCAQCRKAKTPEDRCDLGQDLERAIDASKDARGAAS